jgi:hypothetical protein
VRTHILCLALLAAAHTSAAQATSQTSQDEKIDARLTLRDGVIDLGVPESPAFAALGVTPQEVTRPATGRDLAISLLNGLDKNGNLQTGLSIDTAPYMLLAGNSITLDNYRARRHYMIRFLSRWQTSLATSMGGTPEDKSAKIAFGMRFTVFDRADPRMDAELLRCLSRAADAAFASGPATTVSANPGDKEAATAVPPEAGAIAEAEVRYETSARQAATVCRDTSARKRWNGSAWVAGVAPTWTSPDGTSEAMAYSGVALWTSIGYGFESIPVLSEHAHIAAYVKVRSGEIAPDPFRENAMVTQDTLAVGGRFLLGVVSTQFNGEALYVRNRRLDDDLDDRYWHLGIGVEQRLIDNTWLNVALGRELNRKPNNAYFVSASFKWGIGPRAKLAGNEPPAAKQGS